MTVAVDDLKVGGRYRVKYVSATGCECEFVGKYDRTTIEERILWVWFWFYTPMFPEGYTVPWEYPLFAEATTEVEEIKMEG